MVKITFDEPQIEAEDILSVRLSKNAAVRIDEILQKENLENHVLRISVDGGGCSGYSYRFKLVPKAEQKADDVYIENEDIQNIGVIIDMTSFNYLKGSTIDYEETLEASQFVINNPNAQSSCGCGSSFSV